MASKKRGAREKAAKADGPLSLRAFAPIAGMSQPALSKAIDTGKLREPALGRDAKGKPYIADREEALLQLREGVETLAEAQTRVARQREIKLDLENRVKQGQLIEAREEERRDYERAKAVREGVLSVPDRIAAELAAEGDQARVHEILTAELERALTSLADLMVANA